MPFVGRVHEVGVLRVAGRSAAAGRPGAVLVRGSPGVGKSWLVTEVTEAARRAGAVGGAAARVPDDATAFPYRDGGWIGNIIGVDPDPANADAITQWTRDYFADLHAMAVGGTYVNFMMDEGEDRVRAAYRGNYERLAQVKGRYDPENTFHVNQNIPPAG